MFKDWRGLGRENGGSYFNPLIYYNCHRKQRYFRVEFSPHYLDGPPLIHLLGCGFNPPLPLEEGLERLNPLYTILACLQYHQLSQL